MSHDDNELWMTFASDAAEAIRGIEESLLELERDPSNREEINRLYRGLHTLKGNSAFLALSSIEHLAHACEDLIGLVRDKGLPLDAEMINLVLSALDRLRWAVDEVCRARADVSHEAIDEVLEAVTFLYAERGGESKRKGGAAEQGGFFDELPADAVVPSAAPVLSADQLDARLKSLNEAIDRALREASADGPATQVLLAQCATLADDCSRAGLLDMGIHVVRVAEAARLGPVGAAQLAAARVAVAPSVENLVVDIPKAPPMPTAVTRAMPPAPSVAAPSPSVPAKKSAAPAARKTPVPTKKSAAPPAKKSAAPPRKLTPGTTSPGGTDMPLNGEKRAFLPTMMPTASMTPQRIAEAAASAGRRDERAEFLRIDPAKAATLMDLAGEIGLACTAVTRHPALAGRDLEGFSAAAHRLELLVQEMQNDVAALRLVPVAGTFQRMRRVVRDAAQRTGKRVELEVSGEDTEVDKVMLDALQDPLVHVLRNAVDHGLEGTDDRVAAGKAPEGRIKLSATHQGGEVTIEVRDDGRGIDREKVIAKARSRGLIPANVQLSDEEALNLIFLPGFSTKEKADELSGRGVGMDVVKTTIESMRGHVGVSSTPGKGMRLTMTMPLTLAFVEAMVVREGGRLFALPIERVFEVTKVDPTAVVTSAVDGRTMLRVRDSLFPVLWLHRYWGEADSRDTDLGGRVSVIVQTRHGGVALPVDELLGNQQIMLKPLRGVLGNIRGAASCGMLGTGDVAVTLDCEQLHA